MKGSVKFMLLIGTFGVIGGRGRGRSGTGLVGPELKTGQPTCSLSHAGHKLVVSAQKRGSVSGLNHQGIVLHI